MGSVTGSSGQGAGLGTRIGALSMAQMMTVLFDLADRYPGEVADALDRLPGKGAQS